MLDKDIITGERLYDAAQQDLTAGNTLQFALDRAGQTVWPVGFLKYDENQKFKNTIAGLIGKTPSDPDVNATISTFSRFHSAFAGAMSELCEEKQYTREALHTYLSLLAHVQPETRGESEEAKAAVNKMLTILNLPAALDEAGLKEKLPALLASLDKTQGRKI